MITKTSWSFEKVLKFENVGSDKYVHLLRLSRIYHKLTETFNNYVTNIDMDDVYLDEQTVGIHRMILITNVLKSEYFPHVLA